MIVSEGRMGGTGAGTPRDWVFAKVPRALPSAKCQTLGKASLCRAPHSAKKVLPSS